MFDLFLCRVNCSFYFKIGACRHGDKCSRLHNKPTFSQVSLIAYRLGPIQNSNTDNCRPILTKICVSVFKLVLLGSTN